MSAPKTFPVPAADAHAAREPLLERMRRLGSLLHAIPGARRAVRATLLLARGFTGETISLRASALTYLTLFALVPLLAVIYSVLDLVGDEAALRNSVESWVTQQLGINASTALASRLQQLSTNANVKTLGVIGFAFLLVSVVSLLWNIESAFNHIYGVKRPRKLLDRLLKYWSFITLGPIFLAGSLALTWRISNLQTLHAAHAQAGHSELLHVLTALSAVAITYAALTLLYKVLPNAPVPMRTALTAAFVAGTLWELAKFIFAFASSRMVQVHMIYGSLAVLPITLMWIYISWLITLGGCRLCFALEASRRAEPNALLQGAAVREALTARVAIELVRQHRERNAPIRPHWIASELAVPRRLVLECLRALRTSGLVAETRSRRWLLARDPATITLAELRLCARLTLSYPHPDADPIAEPLVRAWEEADRAASLALQQSIAAFLEAHDADALAPVPTLTVPPLSIVPTAISAPLDVPGDGVESHAPALPPRPSQA